MPEQFEQGAAWPAVLSEQRCAVDGPALTQDTFKNGVALHKSGFVVVEESARDVLTVEKARLFVLQQIKAHRGRAGEFGHGQTAGGAEGLNGSALRDRQQAIGQMEFRRIMNR